MTSPLTALEPQVPITPAAVLRLTEAVNLSTEPCRELLEDTAYLALTNPLFKFLLPETGERLEAFEQTMLNSILVSWCFHLKFGFLMPDGTPTVKGDLPHRLYYLEPRCFLMAHLLDELERSAFHPDDGAACGLKALARDCEGPDNLKDALYLVLLYVLWPVPTRNPVDPVPDLPGCIETAWDEWNNQVVDLIKDYVRQQGRDIEENQLPLDREGTRFRVKMGTTNPDQAERETRSTLHQWLTTHRLNYQARSPFAALSGRGDSFESVEELAASVKSGIFVSDRMIPATDPPARIQNYLWRLLKAGDGGSEAVKTMVQTIVKTEKYNSFTADMEDFQKYVKALNASVIQTLMMSIDGHVAILDDEGRYVVHELLLACRKVERTLQLAQDKRARLSGHVLRDSSTAWNPQQMIIIGENGATISASITGATALTERWPIHRGMKVEYRINGGTAFDVVVHERRMRGRLEGIFRIRVSDSDMEWVVRVGDERNCTDYTIGHGAILNLPEGGRPRAGDKITFEPSAMPVDRDSPEIVLVACYCIWIAKSASKSMQGGSTF
jgi:hypothetical protein